MGVVMSKECKHILKAIAPRILRVKTLSGLGRLLKKNALNLDLELKSSDISRDVVKTEAGLWVEECTYIHQGRRCSGYRREMVFEDLPLIADEDLETWEKSYLEKVRKKLLSLI